MAGFILCRNRACNPASQSAFETGCYGFSPAARGSLRCARLLLLLLRVRPDFRLALRVLQIAELGRHTLADRRRLALILEAGKVGTIAPGERTTQTLARTERRVMHDVDQAFIIRITHGVARKIAEISAGGENRRHPGNRRDFASRRRAVKRLDHLDQNDVVVPGFAIAARNVAPKLRAERLPTPAAALAERRKHGPVARLCSFLRRANGRHYDHQRAGVGGMLYFTLIGIG